RASHLNPYALTPHPPVSRFEYNPRVLTRAGELSAQRGRVIGDPGSAQLPAVLAHPDQHAAVPVQIHSDDLAPGVVSVHKGLPDWWRRTLATSSIRQKRRPASSWHQIWSPQAQLVTALLSVIAVFASLWVAKQGQDNAHNNSQWD